MKIVSKAWKEMNARRITNECFVEVHIDLSDAESTSKANVEILGKPETGFSDTSELTSGEHDAKYATLEQNFWFADGSFMYLIDREDHNYTGYMGSELSSGFVSEGDFPTAYRFSGGYQIDITFSSVIKDSAGMQINWGNGGCASVFAVTFIGENGERESQLYEKNVDDETSITRTNIFDLKKIQLNVYAWSLPYRRFRTASLKIGVDTVYGKNDLMDFEITESVDFVSANLPEYKLRFTVNNIDGKYDVRNPMNIVNFLKSNTEVYTRFGMKMDDGSIEWVNGRKYLIDNISIPRGSIAAEFEAVGIIHKLTDTYTRGLWHPNGETGANLVYDILRYYNIPDGYFLCDYTADYLTKAPMPIVTSAEALQLLANATGKVLTIDSQNRISIDEVTQMESLDYVITKDLLFSYPEISAGSPLKELVVKNYQYSYDAEQEPVEVFSGNFKIENREELFTCVFDTPIAVANPIVNVEIVDGSGQIDVVSHVFSNSAEIQLYMHERVNEVKITILDTFLVQTESNLRYKINTNGTDETISNQIITEYSPWVSTMARFWLNDMSRYHVSDFRLDPRLDVGDIIVDEEGNKVRIDSMKMRFTGMFHGEVEGVVLK